MTLGRSQPLRRFVFQTRARIGFDFHTQFHVHLIEHTHGVGRWVLSEDKKDGFGHTSIDRIQRTYHKPQ